MVCLIVSQHLSTLFGVSLEADSQQKCPTLECEKVGDQMKNETERVANIPVVYLGRHSMPSIGVGDVLPDGNLSYIDKEGKLQSLSVHSFCSGKTVVLFGVPGAFTPICGHVAGYIERSAELKGKGVDHILCMTVNDAYVVREWAKRFEGENEEEMMVTFVADGTATYTKALGMECDLCERGMGIRSVKFALRADNLIIKVVQLQKSSTVNDLLNSF